MKKGLLLMCSVLLLCTPYVKGEDLVSSKVYFRFGESIVKTWFRENDVTLAKVDSLFSLIKASELSHIKVIGSASPEGEDLFNKNLSKERADLLQKYIADKFNISETLFKIEYLGANALQVDDIRDLRYTEVVLVKKTEKVVATPIAAKVVDVTPEVVEQSFLEYNICWWCILILLLITGLIIIAYACKDNILLCFGREGDGTGNLPTDGSWLGVKGNSNYMPEEYPQKKGTNSERKHRNELFMNPFYFKNTNDINVPKAKSEVQKLQEKLKKNQYKSIRYKNNRPRFAPFSLPFIYTKISENRHSNMKNGLRLLAKRWNSTMSEAQSILTDYDLVFHEVIYKFLFMKISVIQIIPKNIHENADHTGGVSDAK